MQVYLRNCQRIKILQETIAERVNHALDKNGEARTVALDISKGFDRVWCIGLLHKLKSDGASGQILKRSNLYYQIAKGKLFCIATRLDLFLLMQVSARDLSLILFCF